MGVRKRGSSIPFHDISSFCEYLTDGMEQCLERGIKYNGIAFHGIDDTSILEQFRKELEGKFKSRNLDLTAWQFPRVPDTLPRYDEKYPDKEGYQRVDLGWFIANNWIEGFPNFVLVKESVSIPYQPILDSYMVNSF
jgi:hypothetical protein